MIFGSSRLINLIRNLADTTYAPHERSMPARACSAIRPAPCRLRHSSDACQFTLLPIYEILSQLRCCGRLLSSPGFPPIMLRTPKTQYHLAAIGEPAGAKPVPPDLSSSKPNCFERSNKGLSITSGKCRLPPPAQTDSAQLPACVNAGAVSRGPPDCGPQLPPPAFISPQNVHLRPHILCACCLPADLSPKHPNPAANAAGNGRFLLKYALLCGTHTLRPTHVDTGFSCQDARLREPARLC